MRGVGSAPRSLRQGDTQNLLPFYNAPIFEQDFPFSSFSFFAIFKTHTHTCRNLFLPLAENDGGGENSIKSRIRVLKV